LLFQSRSVQTATPEAPRAILFGDDARLLLTFNGDSREDRYDVLETIEWIPETSAFRLREVSFPGAGQAPIVSEANPPLCLRCHGDPPRPIWDTYPSWPGAFREQERAEAASMERNAFHAFLAHRNEHDRYRWLAGIDELLESKATAEATIYEGGASFSANASFGMLLQPLRYRSIAAALARTPLFPTYRFALLGALARACADQNLAQFFPDAERADVAAAFERFEKTTRDANASQSVEKRKRLVWNGVEEHRVPIEALTRLRFVAERGLAVSTEDWTLALERGTYDFTTARPLVGMLEGELRALALRDEEERRPLLFEGGCVRLAARSRSAIGAARTAH
jgi:hypothetical protein